MGSNISMDISAGLVSDTQQSFEVIRDMARASIGNGT